MRQQQPASPGETAVSTLSPGGETRVATAKKCPPKLYYTAHLYAPKPIHACRPIGPTKTIAVRVRLLLMLPSSPPRGSPQWAGIRDAWRDSTLAEWLVNHPDGKRLLRVLRVMKLAFATQNPGSLGAAGGASAPRVVPDAGTPACAASSRGVPSAAAPAAACGGPSVPRSASQRRRQRRARAEAAARAVAPAGPMGGGASAGAPAVGAHEASREEDESAGIV